MRSLQRLTGLEAAHKCLEGGTGTHMQRGSLLRPSTFLQHFIQQTAVAGQ
jgi:hypothetical protein